jgi:hypothetical protein
MAEAIELRDFDRPEIEDRPVEETEIDLPDVPVDIGDAKIELIKTSFISDVCKNLKINKNVDPKVYRGLTLDGEGQILYNHKRITYKRGSSLKLYSVKTLTKSPDSKEFLRLIGYISEDRDTETVAPEQTEVMKAKVKSFKATEDWAKREREKASRQLEQATNEAERQKLQESVQYFDQMEIQARRRYNEVAENQFKRINTIINDETRSLGERLRELFRRDGLTIGALITAIGMTISTIVLAIMPHSTPTPTPTDNNNIDKVKTAVKKALVKMANFLLDLAKKALTALPGVIGTIISFLLKTAGEAVFFLSEHLIVLFLALLLGVFEFFTKMLRRKRLKRQD